MERIKALRWTVGGGLPADLSAALSPAERDFFSAYNRYAFVARARKSSMSACADRADVTRRAGCWAPTWAEGGWAST
jgi:hypothetical protein